MLANSVFSFALAFFAPTLSFCSLNTQFFTRFQIILSLFISLLSGMATGILAFLAIRASGIDWLASLIQPAAVMVFLISSERLFTEMFPARAARWAISASFMAMAFLAAWLDWPYLIFSLMAIYALFAAYDLAKNWSRPKTPLFDPELLRPSRTPKNPVKFLRKPNVYLLLLESMHSSEALAKIYGLEISKAEDYLREKKFTIYPNTFSNKHSTPLSLKTILTGSLDFKSDPAILQNFIYNGYKCNFFDSMFYLSQPYIKFIENGNAKMPLWVMRAYTLAGPLFAQSKWGRFFVGGVDPFETDNPNRSFIAMSEVFSDFLAKKNECPTFNILHFGAQHFGDLWYRVADPKETYLEWYERGISQLELIITDILNVDKDALIVAVGDHGAYHWGAVHIGPASPEKNALLHGVASCALVQDYFGVILGIHWGNIHPPEIPSGFSHVNIFHWIFAALAGKKAPTRICENISILNGKFIVARDGIILDKFETCPNQRYSDFYSVNPVNTELFAETIQLDQKLIANDLDGMDNESQELFKKAMTIRPFTDQHVNAAEVLLKTGHISESAALLESYWQNNRSSFNFSHFPLLMQVLIALKKYGQAKGIIGEVLANSAYPHRYAYMYLMRILWREKKYEDMITFIPKLFNTKPILCYEPLNNFAMESTLSHFAIERAKGSNAALDWIERMLESEKQNKEHYYMLLTQKILLLLKYDKGKIIQLYQSILRLDNIPKGFVLLYLQILIQYNYMDMAKTFMDCVDCFPHLKLHYRLPVITAPLYNKKSKEHFIAINAKELLIDKIQKSGVFDDSWYEEKYRPDHPPLIDYINNGVINLRNPNPMFDIHFYLSAYPEVFWGGHDPLIHYINTNKTLPVSPCHDTFFYNNVHPAFRNRFLEEA